MKWLLVVIVASTPVNTDLVYNTLGECLHAESKVRQEWVAQFNNSVSQASFKQLTGEDQQQSRTFMMNQMSSGTCIPSR